MADVSTFARALNETSSEAVGQISKIVAHFGAERTQQFVQVAGVLYGLGGLVRMSDFIRVRYVGKKPRYKQPKRTLGGTFFFLVSLHPEGLLLTGKRSGAPFPFVDESVPAISWSERQQFNTTEKGEASTVKITVVGRPAQVTRARGYVAFVLTQRKVPSLPKGLPDPPSTPNDYLVFVSEKHWSKVEEAMKTPDDSLIIEGWCAFDGETEKIVVWSTNTTTKALQRATQRPS